MGTNPPFHTKHNECVGDCNEGNTNATNIRLRVDNNEGGIFNAPPYAWA